MPHGLHFKANMGLPGTTVAPLTSTEGYETFDANRPPSVCIVTRNRPALVARCVRAIAKAIDPGLAPLKIRIYDDSDEEVHIREVERRLRFEGIDIVVHGNSTRAMAQMDLSKMAGVPRGVVDFALKGAPWGAGRGANTNLAMLDMVGESFVMLDDDVVWKPAVYDGPERATSEEPGQRAGFRCYDRRESLEKDLRFIDGLDFRTACGSSLGSSAGDFIRTAQSGPAELVEANAAKFSANARIVVTTVSLYGDSGSEFPSYYLLQRGTARSALVSSRTRYLRTMCSRLNWKGCTVPMMSSGGVIQGAALGIWNKVVLPPWAPACRGEDNVFGILLRASRDPANAVLHLPIAIGHWPYPGRSYPAGAVWRTAERVSFATVIVAGLLTMGTFHAVGCLRDWMPVCGAAFSAMGRLSGQELKKLLTPAIVELAKMECSRLAKSLNEDKDSHSNLPEFWISDVNRCLRAIASRIRSPRLELGGGERCPRTWSELASYLELFGELLQSWPQLVAVGKEARMRREATAHKL